MQLPARIGKYQLVEFLGGGMSHVYRAHDTVLNRTVALKILTEAGCADSEAKARFLQEARMAGGIVHDNIISVYDFGEEQNKPYIVMEFLRGESLRDAIKNNQTGDLKNKLTLAIQLAHALHYIHDKKIIHRDIKPENLHIDAAGKMKLMDFGIAKSEGVQLTRAGFTLGTPYYMAPEQVLGQKLTHLADIYAFGILLFELLCGQRPIVADSIEKIFMSILREPLNLVPLEQAGVSPEIRGVVARCTAKNPAERYPTMSDVAGVLSHLMAGKQPAATAAPSGRTATVAAAAAPPELPAFMKRLPAQLQTQTGLMLVVGGLVVISFLVMYLLLTLVSGGRIW